MKDRFQPPHPAAALGCKIKGPPDDLLRRIENSMAIIAGIIAEDGQRYLPIFERLEKELEELQKRDASFRRAIDLANRR